MKGELDARGYAESGKSLHQKKKYLPAMNEFRTALELFRAANDQAAVAEMKNNIGVCLQMIGKPEESLAEIEGTAAVFAGMGDVEREAMALGNEASACEDLKMFDRALNLYYQAEKILENHGQSEVRSIILKRISALEIKQKNHLNALASMNLALHADPDPSQQEKKLKHILEKFFSALTKRSG